MVVGSSLVAQHFSCGLWTLEHTGSVVAVCRLSCSVVRGILVLQLEIELASLTLEGRFLSTGPPGKSLMIAINKGWEMTSET